jgi:transcription antitermination factor NusA-like protein
MITKLNTQDLLTIKLIESISKTKIIDYISNERNLYLIIHPKDYKKIIGNNGRTINTLKDKTQKTIIVYKYSKSLKEQIEYFFKKETINNIKIDEELKNINININSKFKSKYIGKNGNNIKILTEFIKRRFEYYKIILK